ncbi:hypothetical protein LXL04_016703 [Taraxacum kok-saghyz]
MVRCDGVLLGFVGHDSALDSVCSIHQSPTPEPSGHHQSALNPVTQHLRIEFVFVLWFHVINLYHNLSDHRYVYGRGDKIGLGFYNLDFCDTFLSITSFMGIPAKLKPGTGRGRIYQSPPRRCKPCRRSRNTAAQHKLHYSSSLSRLINYTKQVPPPIADLGRYRLDARKDIEIRIHKQRHDVMLVAKGAILHGCTQ